MEVTFSVQVRLPGGLFLAVLPVTKQHTIFLYIVFIFLFTWYQSL